MTTMTTPPPALAKPSLFEVARHQRKTVIVAVVLMLAGFWVLAPLGKSLLGACLAGGVLLGLLNHLYTEFWLGGIIATGATPTRNQMAVSTFVRLLILTVVAVGIAALFWPNGIGLLLGLAIFRLIALVMTSIPLLKELKRG